MIGSVKCSLVIGWKVVRSNESRFLFLLLFFEHLFFNFLFFPFSFLLFSCLLLSLFFFLLLLFNPLPLLLHSYSFLLQSLYLFYFLYFPSPVRILLITCNQLAHHFIVAIFQKIQVFYIFLIIFSFLFFVLK